MSCTSLRRSNVVCCHVTLLVAVTIAGCRESSPLPASTTLVVADGARVVVADVVKGDEIVVGTGNEQARVRLVGLHAFNPQSSDAVLSALGEVGAQVLRARLIGKPVIVHLEHPPRDTYGRYLAYVEHEGMDVGRALLEQGVVMMYDEYPFSREVPYRQAEQAARSRQMGLWVKPAAVSVADGLKRQWAEARMQHGR